MVPELAEDAAALGRCNCKRSVIELDAALSPDMQGAVLIHEVVEAINFSSEIRLRHPQISALSTALHTWLRDNQALAARVAAGLRVIEGKR